MTSPLNYYMIIKIDTREQELFKKCESTIESVPKFKDIKLVSEPLPLGDIIINDGTNDCIIIERKTLSDLASSIKDGRYEEQSYRLNGLNHHNHNIIYLIEGDMYKFNAFKDRIDKQTLYSAMFSINYFKGFSIMRSNNMEETAMIACNMVYKLVGGLKAGKVGFYTTIPKVEENVTMDETNTNNSCNNNNNSNTTNLEKEYCSVVKKVKKDNITPDNIGEIMLCQIPGVSSTTALAILSEFKTLPNLIKSIKENETCLNTICTTDANGKSRKISKTAIATIIKFLKI
jgi:crossover junction endonuclease MUS81